MGGLAVRTGPVLCSITLIISICPSPAVLAAEQSLPLTVIQNPAHPETNPQTKSLLRHMIKIGKQDQTFLGELNRARHAIAVVFVPGILGSKLVHKSNPDNPLWGKGSGDATKLSLPQTLIEKDDVEDTDLQVSLLEKVEGTFGTDVYGEAISKFRGYLDNYGLPLFSCPYDWRRDLRAAAKTFDQCIKNLRLSGAMPDAVIIIAHSMGGLVTWTWHQQYYERDRREYPRVRLVAILGTPLGGSCEILRMVYTGYQVPNETWLSNKGKKELETSGVTMPSGWFMNKLSSMFTQDLRPAILTWPGALELLPQPTKPLEENCVPFRKPGTAEREDQVLSHFELEFWTTVNHPGAQLLEGKYKVPSQAAAALGRADDFRKNFKPTALASSTVLYHSPYWWTVRHIIVDDENHVDPTVRLSDQGDGRVMSTAAKGSPLVRAHPFVDSMSVLSPHGELAKDPRFLKDLFENRLPTVINTHMAIVLMPFVTDQMLARGTELDKLKVEWQAVVANMDNQDPSQLPHGEDCPQVLYPDAVQQGEHSPAFSPNVVLDCAIIRDFNERVCRYMFPNCSRSYRDVKAAETRLPEEKRTFHWQASHYASVRFNSKTPAPERVIAAAKEGLALANLGHARAALIALLAAEAGFSDLPDTYDRNPQIIPDLKKTVRRNIVLLLAKVNRCAEAGPRLAEHRDDHVIQMALKHNCFDRELGETRLLAEWARPSSRSSN